MNTHLRNLPETESLTDEQLAGQKLMVGFNGRQLNDDLKFLIKDLKVGGLILFARNIETPDQIQQLCFSVRQYAESCAQPPLLIAIDQEGGQVARLKAPFTEFPGNPAMQSEADAVHFARVTATELGDIGVNMNMAPVLDVGYPEIDGIMDKRVFGNDPFWVTRLGTAVIRELQRNDIMAVAKHFPGIGRTTLDSHLHLPTLETGLKTMEDTDLVPFKAAVTAGVAGMMLSHILYRSMDPDWPASLSRIIARDLLRKRMGYQGVVITDDLDMKAIRHDMPTVIRRITAADIDIALICHKGPGIEIAYREILATIKTDRRLKTQNQVSVERIMHLKRHYLVNAV